MAQIGPAGDIAGDALKGCRIEPQAPVGVRNRAAAETIRPDLVPSAGIEVPRANSRIKGKPRTQRENAVRLPAFQNAGWQTL